MYATGNNIKGALGLPGLDYAIWFSKVHTMQKGNCVKVFAGVDHSFILLDKHMPIRGGIGGGYDEEGKSIDNLDSLPEEDEDDFFANAELE